MTTYEYYKHKYETTFHPALKEFYRLRMEGHSALCAVNMIEDFAYLGSLIERKEEK
jgi:hypothetical protein